MDIPFAVLMAVLGAAMLHASWNALIKSGSDVLLDTATVALCSSVMALPLIVLVRPPEPAAWPFLAASALVHMGYYATLVGAYRAGDLSHGYPIMRGCAPLLIAVSAPAVFGESLSPGGWAGVILISAGVLSLGLSGGGATRRATAWALANACIIAFYTLADGSGVRVSGGTERYLAWLYFFMGLPFGLAVFALRRGALLSHAARHWLRGLAGAVLSGIAYGVALWAMTRAPVAVVAALRESSVIFAALIGALLLHEGYLKERLTGAAVVLAGLVALKL